MRISDWSSDVCSSDLGPIQPPAQARPDSSRIGAAAIAAMVARGGRAMVMAVVLDGLFEGMDFVERSSRGAAFRLHAAGRPHSQQKWLGWVDPSRPRPLRKGHAA